ncbi:MAG: GAF domain-containing protein [Bacteroidota bacterium]|nr:GAF domain-containing protein [Bacteroidota bacterium]
MDKRENNPIPPADAELKEYIILLESTIKQYQKDIAFYETERKRWVQLKNIYRISNHVNILVTRIDEQHELFQKICDNIVEFGVFRMAMIGICDWEKLVVTPIVFSGYEEGYLSLTQFTLDDSPAGNVPLSLAVKTASPQVVNDLQAKDIPWHDEIVKRGYFSGAAFPIFVDGQVVGVLGVYATEKDYFKEDEIYLFEVITQYIGYGMEKVREEKLRKQAEEELRLSQQKFYVAFQSSPDLVTISTLKDGRFFEVNDAFVQVMGYSREEIIGNDSMAINLWVDRRERKKLIDELRGKGVIKNREVQFRIKSGEIRTFLISSDIIRINEEDCIILISRDITERQQAVEEIKTYAHEMSIINKIITACTSASDLVTNLHNVLNEALNATQLTCGGICLMDPDHYLKLMTDINVSDRIKNLYKVKGIKTGEGLCGHCALEKKSLILGNREAIAQYASYELLRNEDIQFYAAFPLIIQDECVGVMFLYTYGQEKPNERSLRLIETVCLQIAITIQNSLLHQEVLRNNETLEEKVLQRTKELETANKELESFSYSVSHDLRAPLRGINGFSKILLEDYISSLDEIAQEYLQRIIKATERMEQLIGDLLNLSRIIRSEISLKEIDMELLAKELMNEILNSLTSERKINFTVKGDLKVHADEGLIKIALYNLLNNAVKFTGNHPEANIELGVEQQDGRKVYYVRDDGAGFDMSYASRLFTPFQRLHSEQQFKGSGIGLATVNRIISRHGGEIWAVSNVEEGATFYFTLSAR